MLHNVFYYNLIKPFFTSPNTEDEQRLVLRLTGVFSSWEIGETGKSGVHTCRRRRQRLLAPGFNPEEGKNYLFNRDQFLMACWIF
jgi:hypothetical protein